MSFSSAERAKLVDLFLELGPNAPTLCEGWATRDLAAHLWVRENRPDAAAGMFVPVLQGHLDKVQGRAAARDYSELVRAWGRGPKLGVLDSAMNTAEHFVHHEDVRRANGRTQPREFSAAVGKQLHGALKMMAPRMLGKSARPVVLYPTGLPRIVAADSRGVSALGDGVVRVHGEVGELLLWAFGREAAQVRIEGDASAIRQSSL